MNDELDDTGSHSEDDREEEKKEAEAVDVILNGQLRVSDEAELKRLDGFRQRASWLLGFSGVILGLGASQADELLKDSRELGSFGHIFAPVALGLAFLFIAAAAVWSLQVLFLGRAGAPEFSTKEIENALSKEFLRKGKAYNQMRIAHVTKLQILARRQINRRSNALLLRAFVALLIAVILFIAQAGVLLDDTVEGHVCPYAIEPAPVALSPGQQDKFAAVGFSGRYLHVELEQPCPPDIDDVPE
jgi:hypothetical protein